jgi:DNA repair protein RadC
MTTNPIPETYSPEVNIHLVEDEQPCTKLLQKGRKALSDIEILSIIIFGDVKSQKNIDSTRKLFTGCKCNLLEVKKLRTTDFERLGLSRTQGLRLEAALELISRTNETDAIQKQKITQSRTAYELFRSYIGEKPYEEFYMLLLNRGNRVIEMVKISEGGVSGTVVDPKKIFKIALEKGASSMLLAHNHPSGNLEPSEADKKLTRKIKDAGIMLDIDVLDHIIVGENEYYSFADQGSI